MPTPECACEIGGHFAATIIYCPLHKAAPALLEALEAVEWSAATEAWGDLMPACPSCDAIDGVDPHFDGCQLQAALKLARGEA